MKYTFLYFPYPHLFLDFFGLQFSGKFDKSQIAFRAFQLEIKGERLAQNRKNYDFPTNNKWIMQWRIPYLTSIEIKLVSNPTEFQVYLNYYLLCLIFIAGNEAISHLQTLFIDTLTKAFTCDDGQTEREENG